MLVVVSAVQDTFGDSKGFRGQCVHLPAVSPKKMKWLLQGYHNGKQLLFSDRVTSFSNFFFRDKEAMSRSCPLYFPCAHRCASTAPMQSFEASVYGWYSCPWSLALRCVALIIA